MSKKPQVTVVVLNWNGWKDTRECLASLLASTPTKIELSVLVADNGSTDGSVDKIKRDFKSVKLLKSKTNLGFAGGNNLGIKHALEAGADYVVLLNNDTIVGATAIEDLVLAAIKNKFDLASPKIHFYKGREYHYRDYKDYERGKVIWYAGGRIDWANVIASHIGVDEVDHGQWSESQETEFATGCCLAIAKKTVEQIGYLDDTYVAYYEDNDYCQRAKSKGLKVGYSGTVGVWHKNAGSSGGSGSKKQTALVDQSRFKFGLKYAPMRAKLALVRQRIKSIIKTSP